jgi:hypothetical protein
MAGQTEAFFVSTTTEIDAEVESGSQSKSAARRRVDAYHEALREQMALRELEQPFLLDSGSGRSGR